MSKIVDEIEKDEAFLTEGTPQNGLASRPDRAIEKGADRLKFLFIIHPGSNYAAASFAAEPSCDPACAPIWSIPLHQGVDCTCSPCSLVT